MLEVVYFGCRPYKLFTFRVTMSYLIPCSTSHACGQLWARGDLDHPTPALTCVILLFAK